MTHATLNDRKPGDTKAILELVADTEGALARNDWRHMLEAIAAVGNTHKGQVSLNALRPYVHGHIRPKRIGALIRSATAADILRKVGHDENDDIASGNKGKMQPRYALGDVNEWLEAYAKACGLTEDDALEHATDNEWACTDWWWDVNDGNGGDEYPYTAWYYV